MNSRLRPEIPVGIFSYHFHGNRLDPRFIPIKIIQNLHGKSMSLRPSRIHPVQHPRPVVCLCSSGSGIQAQNDIHAVIFTGEQQRGIHVIQLRRKLLEEGLYLRNHGRILFLPSHLNQCINILITLLQTVKPFHLIFQMTVFRRKPVGLLRIRPEIRLFHHAV